MKLCLYVCVRNSTVCCAGYDEWRRCFGSTQPPVSRVLHWSLHWGHWAAPWDVTVPCAVQPLQPFSYTCWVMQELNLSNFFFSPLVYFLSLLELLELCTSGSVHSPWFRFSFSPPLGTPFLNLTTEPDPGASRTEPQEVPTASSRLRIPSWVLNALHQRAVGHHINQELQNPPRHLVGNGYRVLASLKHNLKDFGVILRLLLSCSPILCKCSLPLLTADCF